MKTESMLWIESVQRRFPPGLDLIGIRQHQGWLRSDVGFYPELSKEVLT